MWTTVIFFFPFGFDRFDKDILFSIYLDGPRAGKFGIAKRLEVAWCWWSVLCWLVINWFFRFFKYNRF